MVVAVVVGLVGGDDISGLCMVVMMVMVVGGVYENGSDAG